ncbi:MAG: PD40 domain-containing protein [Bacteroidetes bacterium]|nr:PD40 domain-containing protein [Bacteroidota bacterium]
MKTKIFFLIQIILVTLSGVEAFSQKTAKQKIREGDEYFYNNDYASARKYYKDAWELDSSDATLAFRLGVSMYNLRQYKMQSLRYFEKAKAANPESKFYLGNLYHLNGDFQEAINMLTDYKNIEKKKIKDAEINSLIEKSKSAMEMTAHPVNVKIENMGSVINSEYPEYVPVISADESELIFTSRRAGSTGGLRDANGEFFEDIYVSYKKNGQWSSPEGISSLNTPTHDACVGLSPDGELLFLYKPSKDFRTGNLYFSTYAGNDWMAPIKLNYPVNMDNSIESSASLTADGNTLYFSSNRAGGFGKKDIYRVTRLSNGDWSKPMNLGSTINTPEDDDAPFIHPDGKILFFSSQGHKNMGGYDIFKSTYNKEEQKWSEPENLGCPINTPDDDIFFVLSVDGKRGYYSSARAGGYGESDIYTIYFPEENLNFSVMKGMVLSADSSKPIYAKITVKEKESEKLQGIYSTNPHTGKFVMIVPPEKNYSIDVEAISKKYDSFSEIISPGKTEEETKVIKLKAK